jgi:hypothetical protein
LSSSSSFRIVSGREFSFGFSWKVAQKLLLSSCIQGPMLWFWNIFAENNCEKMAFSTQNTAKLSKNWILTLVLRHLCMYDVLRVAPNIHSCGKWIGETDKNCAKVILVLPNVFVMKNGKYLAKQWRHTEHKKCINPNQARYITPEAKTFIYNLALRCCWGSLACFKK